MFELKIIQEIITLCVFVAFAWLYLDERLRFNHLLAFVFLLAAVVCAFWNRPTLASSPGQDKYTLR